MTSERILTSSLQVSAALHDIRALSEVVVVRLVIGVLTSRFRVVDVADFVFGHPLTINNDYVAVCLLFVACDGFGRIWAGIEL